MTVDFWITLFALWNWVWPAFKIVGYVLAGVGVVIVSALASWLGIKTPIPSKYTLF